MGGGEREECPTEDVKKEDGEWSMDCNGVSLTGGHTREPVLQTPAGNHTSRGGEC